jgi:3'(2'), 5'-bisphosphate nucleotidase
MIGLLRRGKPFAGVVMDPWEDRLYAAQRGEGSFHACKGKTERVRVSTRRAWPEMPLVTSSDFPETYAAELKHRIPSPRVPSINSVGIKIGLLVRQIADLYLNHHPVHLWDTAAPNIILEEAGGIMTGSDGQPLTYGLNSGKKDPYYHPSAPVASNGQRHAEFVRIIDEFL